MKLEVWQDDTRLVGTDLPTNVRVVVDGTEVFRLDAEAATSDEPLGPFEPRILRNRGTKVRMRAGSIGGEQVDLGGAEWEHGK